MLRTSAKRSKPVSGAGKTALLQKIGLTLVSISKRSFATDTSLLPAPWANKVSGGPSTLQKSTALRQSITSRVSGSGVIIVSDRRYAAIHQLGGKTRPHIIRPRRKKALHWGRRHLRQKSEPPR